MKAIPAVYHDGAFHPLAPVELPEATNVEVLLPGSPESAHELAALRRTAGAWSELSGVDEALFAMESLRADATMRDEEN